MTNRGLIHCAPGTPAFKDNHFSDFCMLLMLVHAVSNVACAEIKKKRNYLFGSIWQKVNEYAWSTKHSKHILIHTLIYAVTAYEPGSMCCSGCFSFSSRSLAWWR